MSNTDPLKEIQADPTLIVATYPELPTILSFTIHDTEEKTNP